MAEPGARQRRAQARIAAALGEIGFALPGSLVWRTTTCGKARCHCQANPPELHGPYLTWTRTIHGKTVTRKITEDQHAHYRHGSTTPANSTTSSVNSRPSPSERSSRQKRTAGADHAHGTDEAPFALPCAESPTSIDAMRVRRSRPPAVQAYRSPT